MRTKLLLVAALVAGVSAVAPIATASTAFASPNVKAPYSCNISGLSESATGTVVGNATETATTITLSKVVFTITNNLGATVTINKVKVYVPDPNKVSAPYRSGTVKVASTPSGWVAGHDSTGIFAFYVGSITVANGQKLSSAALGAKYTNKGTTGKVIAFKPGRITFNVTKPLSASASCEPTRPVPTFASVTE